MTNDENPLQHRIDPLYGFCVKCLRSERELQEKFVSCWDDEYAQWVAQQAMKRLRNVKD